MKMDQRFELNGKVIDVCHAKFKVQLENGRECMCTLAGKLRQNNIRVLIGDSVTVDISISDPTLSNGRIIWRNK